MPKVPTALHLQLTGAPVAGTDPKKGRVPAGGVLRVAN